STITDTAANTATTVIDDLAGIVAPRLYRAAAATAATVSSDNAPAATDTAALAINPRPVGRPLVRVVAALRDAGDAVINGADTAVGEAATAVSTITDTAANTATTVIDDLADAAIGVLSPGTFGQPTATTLAAAINPRPVGGPAVRLIAALRDVSDAVINGADTAVGQAARAVSTLTDTAANTATTVINDLAGIVVPLPQRQFAAAAPTLVAPPTTALITRVDTTNDVAAVPASVRQSLTRVPAPKRAAALTAGAGPTTSTAQTPQASGPVKTRVTPVERRQPTRPAAKPTSARN
ncbi:MAG: hypothetical protein JO152_03625, partial [Mycobacteriaceae bacterium]|nr:hypothetical protein [Mycobacteriaceae bacterium]